MKKHILLSLVLGLGLLLFANPAKSQNFQIVASFGTAQNWAVPNAVLYEIDYYYPYHQIVHINRERRGRNLFYNVLLEDRGQFVEVFFGRQAIILDINYYHRYPLAQHICNGHCGYHGNFYRNNRVACNHRGHGYGHHKGHNHVAYRSNRNYNTYASRSSAANRNVRPNYSYNNSRSELNRGSSRSNATSRRHLERDSNSRASNETLNRSNRSSRNDHVKKASSARGRESNDNRNSRTNVSVSSRSRN